ncbi:MAG: hypothetical protein HOQ03_02215, partial [Thermoleophilia bacterium]|nr:hypothetical protein [Thermoleophilia bacterium]
SRATPTPALELRAVGQRVLRRAVQPCQKAPLPYLPHAVQQLVVQATKPGTLRAVVSVDFGPRQISPSHCCEHGPPALTLRVFPR